MKRRALCIAAAWAFFFSGVLAEQDHMVPSLALLILGFGLLDWRINESN